MVEISWHSSPLHRPQGRTSRRRSRGGIWSRSPSLFNTQAKQLAKRGREKNESGVNRDDLFWMMLMVFNF